MTIGCGISGIGYPMMGLGNLGLSSTGTFASYDNTALGMNGSIYGMNPMMYGMYNPVYMGNMYNQMETNQVNHASNMHTALMNNQVQATTETDRAQISKMLTNASVTKNIENLRQEVLKGDGEGICREFSLLKNQIYNTYHDELAARGSEEDPSTAATRLAENLYSSIVSAQTGQTVSLRQDIETHCESAMKNGWKQGFRKGHHDLTKEEVLNQCFGTRIDNEKSLQTTKEVTKAFGRVGSVLEKGVIGAGVGVAGYGVAWGGAKLLHSLVSKKSIKDCGFKLSLDSFGKTAKWAAVAFAVGDIIWQICDSNDKDKKS